MPTNAPNREEEFELVLGNKQLLSLFFIVVGFFAAFFSVGYMVGFGHGEKTAEASGLAKVEEPAPKPKEPSLPATLMQEPPPEPPPVAASPKPSPVTEPTPEPPQAAVKPPAPKQTVPENPSASTATPKAAAPAPKAAPKPPPAAKPAAAAAEGGYFLQVAAVRVAADAAELAGQLKSKGYPAKVNADKDDGWQRVVVGPFNSSEAAQEFKQRLRQDGFDTMLRKL